MPFFTRDVPRMLMERMFRWAIHHRTRCTSGDVLLAVTCVTSGWHHGLCFRRELSEPNQCDRGPRRTVMPLPIQVTMVFMRAMLVVMLMLDCLLCVYGARMEDRSEYRTCIANPAGCTYLYAARPPPRAACASP